MSGTVPIVVCIGTYGDYARWAPLAQTALLSAERQTVRPAYVRWIHGMDLRTARNVAAVEAGIRSPQLPEWLCFLDADDTLDRHYIEAMWETVGKIDYPVLVQPSTLGVYPDGREDPEPVLIPPKPLLDGNFMVIGTLIRYAQFHKIGGFADWPCYEDWDLWIRAWRDGAELISCPDAIYRVGVNENSRNNGTRELQLRTYNAIRHQYLR